MSRGGCVPAVWLRLRICLGGGCRSRARARAVLPCCSPQTKISNNVIACIYMYYVYWKTARNYERAAYMKIQFLRFYHKVYKYNFVKWRNRYFSLLLWHYQIWLKIVIDGISEEVGVMTEGLGLRPYPQENIVTTLYLGKPQKKLKKSLLRPYPSPLPLELNGSRNLFKFFFFKSQFFLS